MSRDRAVLASCCFMGRAGAAPKKPGVIWRGKVVTKVEPAGDFWEAEEEHQDYLHKRAAGYTCHYVRPGWKLLRRESRTA